MHERWQRDGQKYSRSQQNKPPQNLSVYATAQCISFPSSVSSISDSVWIVLNQPLTQGEGGKVILDHNRHREILGTGTREVNAWGGDGTNVAVCGEVGVGADYLGAISVPRAPSGCPRRYTGMPHVS